MALEHVSTIQLNKSSVIERLDDAAFSAYHAKKAPEFAEKLARSAQRMRREGDRVVGSLAIALTNYSFSLDTLSCQAEQLATWIDDAQYFGGRIQHMKEHREDGTKCENVVEWQQNENAKRVESPISYSRAPMKSSRRWSYEQAFRHFTEFYVDKCKEATDRVTHTLRPLHETAKLILDSFESAMKLGLVREAKEVLTEFSQPLQFDTHTVAKEAVKATLEAACAVKQHSCNALFKFAEQAGFEWQTVNLKKLAAPEVLRAFETSLNAFRSNYFSTFSSLFSDEQSAVLRLQFYLVEQSGEDPVETMRAVKLVRDLKKNRLDRTYKDLRAQGLVTEDAERVMRDAVEPAKVVPDIQNISSETAEKSGKLPASEPSTHETQPNTARLDDLKAVMEALEPYVPDSMKCNNMALKISVEDIHVCRQKLFHTVENESLVTLLLEENPSLILLSKENTVRFAEYCKHLEGSAAAIVVAVRRGEFDPDLFANPIKLKAEIEAAQRVQRANTELEVINANLTAEEIDAEAAIAIVRYGMYAPGNKMPYAQQLSLVEMLRKITRHAPELNDPERRCEKTISTLLSKGALIYNGQKRTFKLAMSDEIAPGSALKALVPWVKNNLPELNGD